MNLTKYFKFSNMIKGTYFYMISLLCLSCSIIDENWDDCERDYKVRVKYDYNMLNAEAFITSIKNIQFYIFDEHDSFVKQETRKGPFNTNEFTFSLPDGKYKFACIASDTTLEKAKEQWNFSANIGVLRKLQDLKVSMKNIIDGISSQSLPSLWYASPLSPNNTDDMLHINGFGKDQVELSLIRNTNNIRLIIQRVNNSDLLSEEYICTLSSANNGTTDYADQIIKESEFTYMPYFQKCSVLNTGKNPNNPIKIITAEWDVNRLTSDSPMRLVIKSKKNYNTIFNTELVPLLMMLRHEKLSYMPEQEFLDREYEYEFYLLLDDNDKWAQLIIKVKDWVVRINRMDLN